MGWLDEQRAWIAAFIGQSGLRHGAALDAHAVLDLAAHVAHLDAAAVHRDDSWTTLDVEHFLAVELPEQGPARVSRGGATRILQAYFSFLGHHGALPGKSANLLVSSCEKALEDPLSSSSSPIRLFS